MSEQGQTADGGDLEQALSDLGRQIVYPPMRPLDAVVGGRLRARADGSASRPVRPSLRGLVRRLALALLALAALAGGVLVASPDARSAVASWFDLQGVVFLYRPVPPHPPSSVGAPLGLGQRLILPSVGAPDEVYLEALSQGTQVSLVYRPRPGLPAVAGSRVGLLLTEARGWFEHNPVYFKGLEPGTRVAEVRVNGVPAYWLTGKPHLFWYTDASGTPTMERIRLAGNTLLWARNGLIFRLESALSLKQALRIAESVR
ncbi:MAG TPA: hypothetical protein VFE42_02645 [Chloroflexota bacterium]|jgi:hypothetical protein|nr:hypothetical protein [Chloroflexota bacterium]